MTRDATLRLEDFIQAVQSQLDNAQAAMAIKARNLNLPLTFAIKDINLDLRAHVEFADSEIRIRPAAAGEKEASVFHLVFTAITRPAIEENAITLADDPDDQSLDELGDELTSEERKRLEWAGVRTVKQFQDAQEKSSVADHRTGHQPACRPAAQGAGARICAAGPARRAGAARSDGRIRRAAADPRHRPQPGARRHAARRCRIGDRPVSILKSSPSELLLAPGDDQWAGELAVEAAPTMATAMSFDLSAFGPPEAPIEPTPPPPSASPRYRPMETRQ